MKKAELLETLNKKIGMVNAIKTLLKELKEEPCLLLGDDACTIYYMTGDVENKLAELEKEIEQTKKIYESLMDGMEY